METTIKIFSSIFFIGYMLAAFVWPSYRTWKQTGINPLTFGITDSAHDFVGKWFKITIALIPVNIVLQWFDLQQHILPLTYFEIPILQFFGIILCLISWIWTMIAQWQMGNSWRIGIDERNKSQFVTKGLFGISRNPIFFGMLLTLVGYLFLIPNALSVLTLVCGYLLMQVQIRLEEEFLSKQFGESYFQYKNKVRRWI